MNIQEQRQLLRELEAQRLKRLAQIEYNEGMRRNFTASLMVARILRQRAAELDEHKEERHV